MKYFLIILFGIFMSVVLGLCGVAAHSFLYWFIWAGSFIFFNIIVCKIYDKDYENKREKKTGTPYGWNEEEE